MAIADRAMEFTSAGNLEDFLGSCGLPVSQYGVGSAKSFLQLWKEYTSGESVFRMVDGEPRRCVRVVTVHILRSDGKVLHEVAQTFDDGRVRERCMPLSEKLLPAEDAFQAARRGIHEELGAILPASALIEVDRASLVVSTSTELSLSYPGLMCEETGAALCQVGAESSHEFARA